MNILNVENVSKTYMSKPVLSGITVGIGDTDKIGVVGTNGTGKSTLLSIVAGVEHPDSGKVVVGNDVRISYLPQNPVFDENKTLLENITEKIYAGEGHWDKMGEIKANLAKFGMDDPECNPSVLSGGQKKRAALVAAIMTPADLLILDEPTNHLDSEMIEWLEEYLQHYRGAILMVTHDRYFLDEVTDQILEIDKGNTYRYESNYSGFLELKQQRLDYEQAAERKAATLYKKDLAWMLRGARARSTKQKAHIQRFEALKDRQRPEEERQVQLSSIPTRMGNKTIILENLSKSYGDRTLFKDFSYTFQKLDRIGIIGPNGCGKSTLLKCILGEIKPDTGTAIIGQTIKIGYFGQENEALDEKSRVLDYIKETAEYIETVDGLVSATVMCERFLFTPDMQYAPISKLSGGEKRRLYLLRVLMEQPNVIVLDEPTNDLDIQTLRILEDYLDGFPGIIITVSHDRYFLDRVVTRVFAFEPDGTLFQSEGGYSDYVEHKKENGSFSEIPAGSAAKGKTGSDNAEKNASKGKYRAPREKTKLSYKEQREYESIEAEIDALTEKSEELEKQIIEAATDFPNLMKYTKEKEAVDEEIEQKMERFIELQEMVDRFGLSK
ncbi:MAG: ABC-F family ATP-binding cassette domain-containing protein [Butyrivibrio sp.]|jgi:ATP-binding cassette subfamily F protein uup|uniref:ABC-F family ATP-binding cassette domain-containing protein n=1 Tax=Butyrivibrio sp. LB2008 TaxID=1408305 RepID=UPI00047C322C|nr:ABC-F family ATP-binding cassette domain-containing protein [Butyrivibrio sp. LB2008]MEE3495606.1 ABC-F family ATP-binding cassette domain-containing protein [Butyrivibrio sp.]